MIPCSSSSARARARLPIPPVVHSVFSFIRFVGGFVASMYRFVFPSFESAVPQRHANTLISIHLSAPFLAARSPLVRFRQIGRGKSTILPLVRSTRTRARAREESLTKKRGERGRRNGRKEETDGRTSDFSAKIPSQPAEASGDKKKGSRDKSVHTYVH